MSATIIFIINSTDTVTFDITATNFAINNTSIPITFGGYDITFNNELNESVEQCDYVSYNVDHIVFPICIRKAGYISHFIRTKHEWVDCHELNHIIKYLNNFTKLESTTINLFIDVGANIGSCSFTVASSAYYNTNTITQVIAFEPLQSNLYYFKHTLSKNVKLFDNIMLVECAAGSKKQEKEKRNRTIIVNSRNKGDARVEPISAVVNNTNHTKYNSFMPPSAYVSKSDTFEQQQICLTSVDSILSHLKYKNFVIPLMKIDVQGYEQNVLFGTQILIEARKIFCIRFEFDPYMMQQVGSNPLKLLQFLDSNGYDIFMKFDFYHLSPFQKLLGPNRFELLIEKYTKENKYCDLYALLRMDAYE